MTDSVATETNAQAAFPSGENVELITTSRVGRFVAQSRQAVLAIDATPGRGGPGETWAAAELFLAALAACAISSVTHFARVETLPVRDVVARAAVARDPEVENRFAEVVVEVEVIGVDQSTAEHLVELFTASCPVYGTVSRGARVELVITARP